MPSDLIPFKMDLHIHTVVSPCAEVEMIPPFIVERAIELGLDMIAITDHNTAENVRAVQQAAQGTVLKVIAGMEVQTREEVHMLCLFDTAEQICAWQARVCNSLPAVPNRPEVFGAQFVVDSTGEYICDNERLLLTSTDMSVEDVVAGVQELQGLAIAAHVDRPSYSLLANLGFVPEDLALGGLEISRRQSAASFRKAYANLNHWPLIASSDAHQLSDMTVRTQATMASRTVAELARALRGEGGRQVCVIEGADERIAQWGG